MRLIQEQDRVAQRLAELTPLILDVWELQVREELPASRAQEPPILRDHLPVFLLNLAEDLSPATPVRVPAEHGDICRLHGQERAWTREYTLDQVLREYSVLRRVLVQVLSREGTVPLPDLERIHTALDRAMETAGTEFVRVGQDYFHQAESQARLLLESVLDYAIFALDTHGRFTAWNAGAQRLTGYEEAEVVGQHASLLYTPEDRAAAVPERELAQAAAEGSAPDVRWHVRKDGTRFWAHGVVHPLRNDAGYLLGFVKVMADATERKRLEESLQERTAQLEHADQRKNEFLAMLAHEVRTPISAISNALYLLENIRLDDERSVRQIASASRQTRQVARLVEDLLDVSRITQGKLDLRMVRVDVVRIAREAAETVQPFVEGRGQSLTTGLTPDPVWVAADPSRLEQVMTNLLNNAVKYTEPGGRIWLLVGHDEREAVITVRDTGIGIEAPMLPQIFDLFTQTDRATARAHGGLGIGLTLVRRLVELHGGTVSAQSAGLDQGSEFTVRLPLCGLGEGPAPI